ncbi:LysE family translocator [Sinorhizobium mexicanum]|uniref:LysE family translocator n=1 Tax=Sinorhizobium mexicanum TaxID=375549 RepID=A0A859QIV9_9HYPH|nr:LysE family translocator [Sinorhizobium mexicanum]QLL62915.1 LysE family translocator [Sinorhizobium mexicanum]
MLEYSLAHWMAFLTAAILLNVSPGPDMALILGHTIKTGTRAGFSALFGIWTGSLVHVLLAAFGLSAVLAASATAFTAVKWIGAVYLVWLGIQALRAGGGSAFAKTQDEVLNWRQIYRQGVLVAALNPKVAIFFLAFLPQFVVEGAGPAWLQLAVHGLLIIVVAAFIEPPLILAGARFTRFIKRNGRISLWLDRGLGALFIALGIRLAMTTR